MSEAVVGEASTPALADNVQAGAVRAQKTPWSLFFFFRILTQAEMAATVQRLQAVLAAPDDKAAWAAFQLDIENPALLNTGLAPENAPAADAFRDWLKVLVKADASGLRQALSRIQALITSKAPPSAVESAADFLAGAGMLLGRVRSEYKDLLKDVKAELRSFPKTGGKEPVLQKLVLYELLRQGAPAFIENGRFAAVRSEADQQELAALGKLNTRAAVNISFSYEGLKALNLDPVTLASFPDVFKEGMAARARRLHDVGPSAPEYWEGELGQRSVHGFFRAGSPFEDEEETKAAKGKSKDPPATPEVFWRRLREDIGRFNERVCPDGQRMRFWLGLLFRMAGVEVVHIELGQDPYRVDKDGNVEPIEHRKEHFGFRDGISQPFVDLKLGAPPPGGATPSSASTWTPVAPGEIFLSEKDEDGDAHLLPINSDLRLGSTFTVFRKLEQDVQGFRSFLEVSRPKDKTAQMALAAQFVGRWPNGMPLVLAPNEQPKVADESGPALNDFRYAAMDPLGRKCPLGAHVRRTNPRDIAGSAARRHRILRRGVSYGGPLIEEGDASDGAPRGILFIAENARIDLQFEVVQGDWINGGELLGQAGLGRCPVTGMHAGRSEDSFLEAGRAAPITRLPQFVTTRGGDYFFTPGVTALAHLAIGKTFPPAAAELPFAGYSMGDAVNRPLVDEPRLRAAGNAILFARQRVVRISLPTDPEDPTPKTVVLIALHKDAQRVLGDRLVAGDSGDVVEVSAWPYRASAHSITRGHDVLVGTDPDPKCGFAARTRLWTLLNSGWQTLAGKFDKDPAKGSTALVQSVRDTMQKRLEASLRRSGGGGAIDLVGDLAVPATYAVLCDIYGVAGPSWITELAVSLPFSRQHVGDLPPEWLLAMKGEKPQNPGQTTMQLWSAFLLADLIGNFVENHELRAVSRQAGAELMNHLDLELDEARSRAAKVPKRTLIDAIVENADKDPAIRDLYKEFTDDEWRKQHDRDAVLLLLEILGTTLAVIPLTFASVMEQLLKSRIDLRALLDQTGLGVNATRIIYEAERLNPNVPVRMRRCERDIELAAEKVAVVIPPVLPEGSEDKAAVIKKGEYVGTLINAAHLDPRRFDMPQLFWPFAGAPPLGSRPRKETDYLLFGTWDEGSNKKCWGRDRVALPVLEECLSAASRLGGLRRVAGKAGEPQTLVGIKIGLKARFTRVEPKADASAEAPKP
ncbi:hypothetical protein [Phenylobacterium sp.]|jgi:deferrochelatase/peroxidase EfeB/cytochrome P450|uniref:hypothetical protein n=1 Tax=Phenylobacterium sp. TaxID=1871053 RepID=UPI002F921973